VKQLDRLATFLRKRPNVELQLRGRASRREAKALPKKRRRGRGSTEQKLRKLAEDRARLVERTLVRRRVAAKRLFVLTGDPNAVKKRGTGRVEFRLLD
jgi:outer membrane protein OmpA-like peptidoglycan-associated protein